jgi:hypothetical protein
MKYGTVQVACEIGAMYALKFWNTTGIAVNNVEVKTTWMCIIGKPDTRAAMIHLRIL